MPTTQPRRQNHGIANLNAADLAPNLLNNPRDVVTQNMWHFDFEPRQPLECPQIKMIQSAGPDFYQDLGGADAWHRGLGQFKLICPPMSAKDDGFHYFLRTIRQTDSCLLL